MPAVLARSAFCCKIFRFAYMDSEQLAPRNWRSASSRAEAVRSLYHFVEKLVFRCAEDQFQPAGYAHLIEDGSQVVLHRLIADRQFYGDILIGVSGQNGCDDLAFTGRDADSNPCNAKSQKREEVRKSAGVCTTVFSYVRQRLLNDPCNFTAHTRRQCDIFVVADKLC